MKLEQKVYVYGFTIAELAVMLAFFLLGFVLAIYTTTKIGFFWGFMILATCVAIPVVFIKVFIHSKQEGYFINLFRYTFRPKFFIPKRNIEYRRTKDE